MTSPPPRLPGWSDVCSGAYSENFRIFRWRNVAGKRLVQVDANIPVSPRVNSREFERVTAGDPGEFAILYDRYARLVRSICFDRVRNLTDAEDLTQDIFLRAYQRIGQLRRPDRIASWLAAIARCACQDWRRQRVREKQQSCGELPDLEVPRAENDQSEIDALRLAICELPEKERLALHIHYLCEQPAEVARDILGMSSSGFYKLIERARRQLAVVMKTRGVQP